MPDIWMDVDTAVTVPCNKVPLVDATDGKTFEISIAYNEAGMNVAWNFVTSAGVMTTTAVTPTTSGLHDWLESGTDEGMYKIEIPASGGTVNNDTEGVGWLSGTTTSCLPFAGPTIGFRTAALNNALIDGGDLLDVNVTHVADTLQTGRDIGASVLLSSGSGAGQLDFTSGVVKSNLAQILGTALTETAGYLSAGFKKLFNIQTPVLTMESVNQSANNNTILAHADYGNAKLARTGADSDTLETLSDQIDGCNTVVPDAAGVAATPAEVATALTDINLDHLCKTATAGADMTAEVVDNSILSRMLANGDTSAFDPTSDGLQLIRDRGDAAWTTGAGGSDRLLMVDTTIATLASQTSFTLTAGSADDNAYNNCTIVIEDVSTATQKAVGIISDYTGGTKTIILKYDPAIFTMAATDKVYILAENALKSTLANRQLNVAADGDIAGNVDGEVATLAGHTAQTGDSYAIVNHADHGNAKLVRSTTPANKLDVSATGEAGLDFANIKNATGAHTLTNITVPTVTDVTNQHAKDLTSDTWTDAKAGYLDHSITTVDGVVDGIQTDLSNATDGLGALKTLIDTNKTELDGLQGTDGKCLISTDAQDLSGTFDVNTKTATATALDLILKNSTFALAIADAVWDEILTGATHNVATSAGKRLREIAGFAVHTGTAQAGTSTSITLAAGANGGDGIFNRNLIVIIGGTGTGQTRTIADYNDTTKICVIDREWRITPDATSEYQILADDTPLIVDHGVAQAGTSTTIRLRAYASSTDDTYTCNIIIIIAGTGRGQARLVGSYNGATKDVTICGDNWVTTPDTTSVYVMLPYGASCASCIGTYARGQINTEIDNALDTAIPGSPTADSINQRVKAIDDLSQASGSGDLVAIKTKTDNLPSGIAKNVALPKFDVFMVLSSDHVSPATGKTITGQILKDGGAFAGITNTITEVGNGVYTIASGFTQTEMNADVITLKFTETDCDQRIITIYTT